MPSAGSDLVGGCVLSIYISTWVGRSVPSSSLCLVVGECLLSSAKWGPLSLGDWVWPLTGVLHPGVAAEWGPLSLGDCMGVATNGFFILVWPLTGCVGVATNRGSSSWCGR